MLFWAYMTWNTKDVLIIVYAALFLVKKVNYSQQLSSSKNDDNILKISSWKKESLQFFEFVCVDFSPTILSSCPLTAHLMRHCCVLWREKYNYCPPPLLDIFHVTFDNHLHSPWVLEALTTFSTLTQRKQSCGANLNLIRSLHVQLIQDQNCLSEPSELSEFI